MAGWRAEIRKILIQPDPMYVVRSALWLVVILVFVAFATGRLLGWW
jgi:hypothetical protein